MCVFGDGWCSAGSGLLARVGQPLPLLPGQPAPAMRSKLGCGRQRAVHWASKEYLLLSLDAISPLHPSLFTLFNLTRWMQNGVRGR